MIGADFKIETLRTVIRPFSMEDCAGMVKMQQNPLMVKYTLDDPWKSPQDFMAFYQLATELYGHKKNGSGFRYFFAVEEKESHEFMGYCGLGTPEFDESLTEIFYAIDVPYWNRGYATEVAQALLSYGFLHLKCPNMVGFAEKGNLSSIKVLEKIGLEPKGNLTGLQGEYKQLNGAAWFQQIRQAYISHHQELGSPPSS